MLTRTLIAIEHMRPKPLFHSILITVAFLSASLACNFVTGFFEGKPAPVELGEPDTVEPPAIEETNPDIPPEHSTPAGPSSTGEVFSCPAFEDRILQVATQFYEEDVGDEKKEEPPELYLVTYSVSGNQISNPDFYKNLPGELVVYQKDTASQQEIWDYFVTLVPVEHRNSLAEYSIMTDGTGNLLASVAQTLYDPALWALEVDIRDAGDKLNLTYTLIHEYAHLLTLGPEQVTPSEALFNNPDNEDIYSDEVNACPNYFPGEGCSHSASYINAFFNRFWVDIYSEWQDINLIENNDAYYEALDHFYHDHQERFVTSYAATNPEEDIAEAFTFFVLSPRPNDDTIAGQKILFFYRYTELVQLRDEILSKVCKLD